MASSLTQQQINDIYLSLFGTGITPSASDYASLESVSVNAAITAIIQSADVAQYDYPIIRLIEFVTGDAPNAIQLANWANYLETGGSLASVVSSFAASTTFQNVFNNGQPINVNAQPTFAIMYNIIQHALSTNAAQNNYIPTTSQVDAWLATGLSTAQILADFANGDQYSALTAPYIQSYLAQVAAVAANSVGAGIGGVHGFPTGSLFGVGSAPITITDNALPGIPNADSTTAGNAVIFTVSEVGLPAGTQQTWSLSGSALTDNEVTSPTSGTLTLNANGTATITVDTAYNGFSAAGLTLTVGTASDTVTLNAPAFQDFTSKVGETLIGGPESTTFIGVVDTIIVGNNTMSNLVDVAQGASGAGIINTLEVVVDTGTHGFTVVPGGPAAEDTNIQILEVTDLGNGSSGNTFDLQYMPQLTTIEDVGSNNSDTFENAGNTPGSLVSLVIANDDFPNQGFVWVYVTNAIGAAAAEAGASVSITVENSGNFELGYQDTEGADIVTGEFNFTVQGGNDITFVGAQQATSISADGTGSLYLDFDRFFVNSVSDRSERQLFQMNTVDASGMTGAAAPGFDYQFAFFSYDGSGNMGAVDIYQGAGGTPFDFTGAQGNTFVNLNLEVASAIGTPVPDTGGADLFNAQGGTFNINVGGTATGGNDWVRVNSYEGDGETITVIAGGENTNNTNSGNGAGGDYIDLHGWKAVEQTLKVTDGNANNTIKIVSADDATVTVDAGSGNNDITIGLWNGQIFGESNSLVTVNVGDGNNDISVDTTEYSLNAFSDYGSTVDITAGNGTNDVDVKVGYFSNFDITVGNGNDNVVDVIELGYYAGDYTPGGNTITVGSGEDISVDYTVVASYYAYEDVTTINVGNLAGGDSSAYGTVDATIQNYDTVNINGGDGSYTVDVTFEETFQGYASGFDTANIVFGNGDNDITVTDGGGTEDDVNITVGNGNNDITVDLGDNTGSTIVIVGGNGIDQVDVTLDTAGPASTLDITLGNGNDSIGVSGVGGNTVDIVTGSGNSWIGLDSTDLPGTLTVAAGSGYNTLALPGDVTALESGAKLLLPTPAYVSAAISGISALEFTSQLVNPVDVFDLGPNNNVNQIILDDGYNSTPFGLGIGGLQNNGELDLLWGDSGGQELQVPVGSAGVNPGSTFNILLDSQYDPYGFSITNAFGTVDLDPTVAPISGGTVHIVNLESTVNSYYGYGFSDVNDFALIDSGITTLNILGSPGYEPAASIVKDLPFTGGTASAGDVNTGFSEDGSAVWQDGDVYLNLNGSNIDPTTVNANTFYAGIEDTSGNLGNGETFNAVNTTLDDLVFVGGGNSIHLGNYDNTVVIGNGSGNTLTMAATDNVYGDNQGSNNVTVGNGTDNTISLDNNDSGLGNTIKVGNGGGGSHATDGDVINLGTGGNVSGTSITIDGDNTGVATTAGVPNAIDTVNIDSSGGGGNTITPEYVSGSTFNLSAHTVADSIVFNHVADSAFGFNDTVNGFVGGLDTINLHALDAGHTVYNGSVQFVNGSLAALGLIEAHEAPGEAVVVYDYANGTLYDTVGGTSGATPTPTNTLEVQVGVIGNSGAHHMVAADVIV